MECVRSDICWLLVCSIVCICCLVRVLNHIRAIDCVWYYARVFSAYSVCTRTLPLAPSLISAESAVVGFGPPARDGKIVKYPVGKVVAAVCAADDDGTTPLVRTRYPAQIYLYITASMVY